MCLEKIKAEADAVSLDGDRILLYHGSKSGIVGEIAPMSREMCDFGKGFYMGTDPGQPLTLICDFEKSKFYVVSVDMRNLDTIEIKADLDWAMLVAYHRGRMEQIKGTALYDKYSSREIYKQAPAETMNRNWLIFHTLAPEVAIEDLKEIHRQRNGES